jgi:hypothetical protein
MRYLSILLLLGVTLKVNAQQINPVPDYIFRNQMSVGRNAPTDTAAYMSIGPRYGAVKGFMPPMVVDTNAVTGTKRNGLLIFSVQLNNFAYWDSTTSRFRQITAQATVDSLVFATRAWRKKGDDSLGAVIAVKTDTALLSTKAYRQKAVDSLVTLISTLGGGTVLSVGSGYGTNFSTITTTGSVVVDSLVITSRASRDKLKDSLNANIALKVNISDTATMLGAYLRKADTTAMLTPYLRKGDTATMLSPYVRIAGYGLLKGTQTLSVDSALMATRARVQKGIDSVASLVATPDSLLFSTRAWRQKGDDSLAAIIAGKVGGNGTTNYLSKFTGTGTIGNSIVYATTSEVGISTPSPTHPLDVNGRVRVRTIDSTASPINFLTTDNDGVIRKTTPFTGTVTSVATGFGLSGGTITTTGTLVADTNSMATRARVQKAVDSLNVNIAAKGSGTVTSVSAGTGMSFTTITTTGSVSADTTVLSTRAWRQKGIDSVANLSRITGSGTTNYVAKFTGSSAVGNSQIFDNGTNVGINTTGATSKLSVTRGSSGNVAAFTSGANEINEYSGVTINSVISGTDEWYGSEIRNINTVGSPNFLDPRLGFFTQNSGTFNAANRTEKMSILGSGSVGIGTTTPSYLLDVSGTMRSTGNTFLATSGSNETLIGTTTSTAGGYRLQVAGSIYNTTGAVLAASSGNVTIGGTGGSERLTVLSPSTSTSLLASFSAASSNTTGLTNIRVEDRTTNSNGVAAIDFRTARFGTDGNFGLSRIGGLRTGSGSSDLLFYTSTTADAPTEKMRITSNGKVGIGVSNIDTNYILNVNGKIRALTQTGGLVVGKPLDSTRSISMGGNATEIAIWMEQGDNVDHVDIFMNRAKGSITSRANVDSGMIIGNMQYQAYMNGLYRTGARAYVETSKRDSANNRIEADFIFENMLNGVLQKNMVLKSNGKLIVKGNLEIDTIDSTANAINMLYADANGVIKKTAVPASSVTMSTDEMTAASGWTVAYDKTQAYPINDVNKTADGGIQTVTINTAVYRTTATFNTDQWVHVATVPSGFRPDSDVYFSLPNTVAGGSFRSTSSVAFTSYNFYQEETAIRVLPNGNVEVYVGLVSNSADLSGANYVIMPIAVTYNIETYPN